MNGRVEVRGWAAGACSRFGSRFQATCAAGTCTFDSAFEVELGAPLAELTLHNSSGGWVSQGAQNLPGRALDVFAEAIDSSGERFLYGCTVADPGARTVIGLRRLLCDLPHACAPAGISCPGLLACGESRDASFDGSDAGDAPDLPDGSDGSRLVGRWTLRRQLTLNNTTAEPLVGFPLLVVLTSARIDYAQTRADGRDILFVDADGTTVLAHEIDTWDEVDRTLIWVRVPEITSGADHIWMYYGNADTPDTQRPSDVWRGFESVYHMSGVSALLTDSTGNHAPALSVNNTPADPVDTQIGSARWVGQTDGRYIDARWIPGATGPMTWELRFSPADSYINNTLMGAYGGGTNRIQFALGHPKTNPTPDKYLMSFGTISQSLNTAFVQGRWYYAAVTRDATGIALYHNGTRTMLHTGSSPDLTFNRALLVGAQWGPMAGEQVEGMTGRVDEVRTSTVARSETWIQAQYDSMGDNGFVVYDPEATPTSFP